MSTQDLSPQDLKLAIFGAGAVGAALGRNIAGRGMPVKFGVRPSSQVDELLANCDGRAEAVSFVEAAAWADVVFLALATSAAVPTASAASEQLRGKILVDCTNPVAWNDGPVWDPPSAGSVAAALAQALPETHVVKGFNTFGAEIHGDPDLDGEAAQVLLSGDDAGAKSRVAGIAELLGFAPLDAGPLRNAAALENHAILWIHLALVGGHGREWAFQRRGR